MRKDKITKIYGEMPKRPLHLGGKVESGDPRFAAGKAALENRRLIIEAEGGIIELPIKAVIPAGRKAPIILYLSFEDSIPSEYLPAEEIIDRGYGICQLNLAKVAEVSDKGRSAIARRIAPSRKNKSAPGATALWAWAAMRVAEHICDDMAVDEGRIIIAGHGIAAAAALLCASQTEKIGYVIANDPYSALGEGYAALAFEQPRLFSPAYAEKPSECPIGALLYGCADRCVLLGSALDRPFADPAGEEKAVSGIGEISYHRRRGGEYFSREDWNIYLDFLDKRLGK